MKFRDKLSAAKSYRQQYFNKKDKFSQQNNNQIGHPTIKEGDC